MKAFAIRTPTTLKVRAYDKAGNASGIVSVKVNSQADRLVLAAPAKVAVKPKALYMQAKVTASLRSTVAATMSGKGLKKAQRWRFTLSAGSSIVQLRLPKTIARPGTYKLAWVASTGTKKAAKTTRVVLSASGLALTTPKSVTVAAKAVYLKARVTAGSKTKVAATMTGKGLKKAQHWHFTLPAGSASVQLRLPATIKRPGTYRLVLAGTAGKLKGKRTIRVVLRK